MTCNLFGFTSCAFHFWSTCTQQCFLMHMVKRLEEVFIFGKVMDVKSWPFNFCQKGGGGWFILGELPPSRTCDLRIKTLRRDVMLTASTELLFFLKKWSASRDRAMFPDFYRKQAFKIWKRALQAFGNTRKKKRTNTGSFVASLGAGVQPGSTTQLCVNVIDVEKRPPRGLGFIR